MSESKKIAFYTLGCKVNQYETQAIKEQFSNKGYEVVSEGEFANVYIINSCSVTGISDRKTRQFIRKTKKVNPNAVTAVIGCYAETGTDVVSEIEEVDIILGTAEKSGIFDAVESYITARNESKDNLGPKSVQHIVTNNKVVKTGGVNTLTEYDDYGIVTGMDSRTRAYIKIEDGCDRFCSYCIIPYARGPVRSRPVKSILDEAQNLISKGYKELILTGINAALYGTDFGSNNDINKSGMDLISLIEKISDLPGDFRIRLSSLEPTVINAEYAKRLVKIKRLCPHLHLSLQSGSDKILKSMGRRYTRSEYLDIISVLKSHDPNYSITTDIIVGYPGESEEDFADSLSMVKEAGFSKVHVFKYSKRQGTPAAEMNNQVLGEVKNQRSQILINAAEDEAQAFLERNKGTVRETLVLEQEGEGSFKAVTDNDLSVTIQSDQDITNSFFNIEL